MMRGGLSRPPLELNLAGGPPPRALGFPARNHRESNSNSNSNSAASGNMPFVSAHNSVTAAVAAVVGGRGPVNGTMTALCRWMR